MESAIRTILDEHRSISAVLHGLRELASAAQDPKVKPEFPVFHAMIYYIDAFPERLHHPKEELALFTRVAERAPEARPLVAKLREQHVQGAALVRELEHALLAFEASPAAKAAAFREKVEEYARFHWEHMRMEEKDLLPLAQKHLTAGDWADIARDFEGNEDPVADLREKDFRTLYQRILNLAPQPIGFGERWKVSA